jgi:phage terminase small subunit
MQNLIVDGTAYKLKFDRDPMEIMKLARKAYKPKKPKDIRKFPTWLPSMSTAAYIRAFDKLNMLQAVDYIGASETSAAQYDPAIPLFEILPDEVSQ